MSVLYPPDDHIHVFSSHAWKHGYRRDDLHRLLQPEWIKGVDYQDRSVTWRHPIRAETDPQLGAQLRDIIAGCDALLIMAGMYANNSEWMLFEIHTAFALGVPIIPIAANGQSRFPRNPTRLASCEPVRWRGDSIRQAIWNTLPHYRRLAFDHRRQRERDAALARQRNAFAGYQPPLTPPAPFDLLGTGHLPQRRLGDNALADMLDEMYRIRRRK